jgi:hypothetical protein
MSEELSDNKIERKGVPESLYIQVPDLTSDNVLDLTQRVRIQMLKQYLHTGQLPEDPKDAALVVKLLADMDKQDLSKKKLVIDEKSVGANSELAAAAINLVRQLGGSKGDPYAVTGTTLGSTPMPAFDNSKAGDITVKPGELEAAPRDFAENPL